MLERAAPVVAGTLTCTSESSWQHKMLSSNRVPTGLPHPGALQISFQSLECCTFKGSSLALPSVLSSSAII